MSVYFSALPGKRSETSPRSCAGVGVRLGLPRSLGMPLQTMDEYHIGDEWMILWVSIDLCKAQLFDM